MAKGREGILVTGSDMWQVPPVTEFADTTMQGVKRKELTSSLFDGFSFS